MTIVPAGQAIARIGQFAAIIPSYYKYTIVVLIKYSMPVLSLRMPQACWACQAAAPRTSTREDPLCIIVVVLVVVVV